MEILTEIIPGLSIVGAILLWSHAHGEIVKMRRKVKALVKEIEALKTHTGMKVTAEAFPIQQQSE